MFEMKLVVGLGNPGERYADTRHNLGFRVVEELANRLQATGSSWTEEEKFKSEICRLQPTASGLILVKPQTHMNASGMAVAKIAKYFKVPFSEIVIIHDELDLPLGKIKVRVGGSAAGHRGVESVIEALGDDKFARIRLGIGTLHSQRGERDRQRADTERFVLEPFEPSEKAKVKHVIKQAVEALEILLDKGLETAQSQFN